MDPVLVWPVDLPTLITDMGDAPEEEEEEEGEAADIDDDDDDVEIALAFKHGRDEKISSEVGLFRKLKVLRNPMPPAPGLLLLLWLIRLFGLMLPFR